MQNCVLDYGVQKKSKFPFLGILSPVAQDLQSVPALSVSDSIFCLYDLTSATHFKIDKFNFKSL